MHTVEDGTLPGRGAPQVSTAQQKLPCRIGHLTKEFVDLVNLRPCTSLVLLGREHGHFGVAMSKQLKN